MSRRKLTGLSGSHHILAKPSSPDTKVIVPVHGARDLPPGTVRSIVAQSKLSIEEFLLLI